MCQKEFKPIMLGDLNADIESPRESREERIAKH